MVDINDYTREVTCEYKGELYSVRNNGAVKRHVREGKKARKLDDVWTFGIKDKVKGYMMISSHRVHIIVAKAFIPGNEDGKMVVDHIDTNRCNNRVENLRWLTRLENVLLNEATLKKVTYLCGGDINKFIENPSCLQDLTGGNQDVMWMRTVTPEEAKLAWEHIKAWAKRPCSTFKMMKQKEGITSFEEWLETHKEKENHLSLQSSFGMKDKTKSQENNNHSNDYCCQIPQQNKTDMENENPFLSKKNVYDYNSFVSPSSMESLTIGTSQIGFPERMEFPLCPSETIDGLDAYAKRLEIDKVFCKSGDGTEYLIESIGWSCEWESIQVSVKTSDLRFLYYIHVSIDNGKYIHALGESKDNYKFCNSPYVLQYGAKTQCYFPLCPRDGKVTLEEYANLLIKDALVETNRYGNFFVYDREICQSDSGSAMIYVGVSTTDSIKNYGDLFIFIENDKIIHRIGRTFFDEKALQRNFCKIRGIEWDDSQVIMDDYC